MKICPVCNLEISAKNGNLPLPFVGLGKLSNGEQMCGKCYVQLNKIDPVVQGNTKKYSAEDIKGFILNYSENKQNEDSRLNELKNQIRLLNPSVVDKREVKELLTILVKNEVIEKINSGFLDEGKGMSGNGLIVATNYRVIFIDKSSMGFGLKMEDFAYDKISSVSIETGLLKSVIKIICSGNTAKINLMSGAKEFSEFIRQKTLLKPEISSQSDNRNSQSNQDIIEQIEKLAILKDKGILTEEEFVSKKTVLLEKL